MTRDGDDDNAVIEPTTQMMDQNQENPEAMKDRYYMAYILFYALGTLTLVPANFFTTANDYWMYKFRDPSIANYSSENRTGLQAEFTSTYSIVANVCNIAFLVITVALHKKFTVFQRLVGALSATLLLFGVTVLFVEVDTDSWQKGFFAITLITGGLLTAAGSVFLVTLFGVASKFPPSYLASILSGQSICGIFAALVQIFSLSIGASSTTNGLVYFLVGMFFVFLTLIAFVFINSKSKFFNYHLNKEVDDSARPKITKEDFLATLNKLKTYLGSMIIVLGCSVMVHPAITSLVQSVNKGNGNRWNDDFFVPVTTFLFYNICDYAGRELAGKIKRPQNGIFILIVAICRIPFVPLLMLCNAQPRHHLDVAFNNDWTYIILIIIFGLTNGYLVNLCVIQVPRVTTKEEKGLAMILIVVFMIVGLGTCSLLSAALVNAL